MSALGRPPALAALLVLLAACVHPALGAGWIPARPALAAALALLVVLGLASRAASAPRPAAAAALLAVGATALVAALAVDGVRGHHGSMRLAPGEGRPHFDEVAPDGRPLGLRPFGFVVSVERVAPDASVTLSLPGGAAVVSAERSASAGGYRFAEPRLVATGGAARLRVSASDGSRTWVADVSPGRPARAGDVTIAVEQYFPDFALDERQQPFSRSLEPRNPAALLAVESGGRSHRAFVLESMPGVHRIEPLGLAFSLLDVEPERAVEVAVHREPAALAALAGGLLAAAGLLLSLVRRPAADAAPEAGPETPLVVAGFALVASLALVDGGGVLAWTFRLAASAGRAPLPGVGVLLGAALVAALGGTLLLVARSLAGGEPGGRVAARAALWASVGLAAAALALAAARFLPRPEPGGVTRALLGLGLAVSWTAGALVATRPSPPRLLGRLAPLALPVAVFGATLAAPVAGGVAVLRSGTYDTAGVAAVAATALLGLAALERTGAAGLRRAAFLVALLALLVA